MIKLETREKLRENQNRRAEREKKKKKKIKTLFTAVTQELLLICIKSCFSEINFKKGVLINSEIVCLFFLKVYGTG